MSGLVNLNSFMDWLKANGAPSADMAAYRAGADGILALANKGSVQAEHVAKAIALARDSGLPERDLVHLLKIGSNLIRFQAGHLVAGGSSQAPKKPFDPGAHQRELSGLFDTQILAGPPQAATVPAPAINEPPLVDAAPKRRPISWVKVGIVLGLPLLTATFFLGRYFLSPDAPLEIEAKPAPAKPAPAKSLALALAHLDLKVTVPEGWLHSPADDQTQPATTGDGVKASIIYRGGSAKDPDEGVFLGVLPLPEKAALSESALLAVAGSGQRATSALIAGSHAPYVSEGCQVTSIAGQRAGLCRGTTSLHDKPVALRTYLLLGRTRAVMALFLAKTPGPSTAARADNIIGSISF